MNREVCIESARGMDGWGGREDVSTSRCSIFIHVVSFVINVNNITFGYHGTQTK